MSATNPGTAISVALRELGVKTKRAQAKMIGEHQQHWGQSVLGRGNPTAAKLEAWLDAIQVETGHKLELTLCAGVWTCR